VDDSLNQQARELRELRIRIRILQERLRDALANWDDVWVENIKLKKKVKELESAG
jgi:hypothetical protein